MTPKDQSDEERETIHQINGKATELALKLLEYAGAELKNTEYAGVILLAAITLINGAILQYTIMTVGQMVDGSLKAMCNSAWIVLAYQKLQEAGFKFRHEVPMDPPEDAN